MLNTDAGQLAQRNVAARLLHRIDKGGHRDLAAPLKTFVDSL